MYLDLILLDYIEVKNTDGVDAEQLGCHRENFEDSFGLIYFGLQHDADVDEEIKNPRRQTSRHWEWYMAFPSL